MVVESSVFCSFFEAVEDVSGGELSESFVGEVGVAWEEVLEREEDFLEVDGFGSFVGSVFDFPSSS